MQIMEIIRSVIYEYINEADKLYVRTVSDFLENFKRIDYEI